MSGLPDIMDVVGYHQCGKALRRIKWPGPGVETEPFCWDGQIHLAQRCWHAFFSREKSLPFSQTQPMLLWWQPPTPGPLTDDNEDHTEELNAWAQQGAEDHGVLGWPEDITVHQLPPRLFHGVFLQQRTRKWGCIFGFGIGSSCRDHPQRPTLTRDEGPSGVNQLCFDTRV